MRLTIIGNQIQISHNGVTALTYTDLSIFPQGVAGFTANSEAVVRVDDFAVYGTPATYITLETATPSPSPTLTPTATLSDPIGAPSNVQATVSESGIVTLTWQDNTIAESGFAIYHELISGSVQSGGTATNVTTYTLPEPLGCGLTVWYSVSAITNEIGASSISWLAVSSSPCQPLPCLADMPTQLVSIGAQGTRQSSQSNRGGAAMSADGRYILFASASPLTNDPDDYTGESTIGALDLY